MQVINITRGEIQIGTKKEKIISYNISYFSYLGASLKFGTKNGDTVIDLIDYEIYVNGKLRWSNNSLIKKRGKIKLNIVNVVDKKQGFIREI